MTLSDIPGFASQFFKQSEIDIHFVHNGSTNPDGTLAEDHRPVALFLHGFPEYHGGWRKVLPKLSSKYLIIAPDQRGFNLSSAPQELEAYQTKLLVGDMIGLMAEIMPERDFHLVGHDWGASIAYALAMRLPDKIKSLTIINGVHPITFQRALINDADQIKASQYIHVLSAPGAVEKMSEDGFARTFGMFEKFSSTPWLTPKIRQYYLRAWSGDGRMNAMLNWYRATPMVIPLPDQAVPRAPLLDADPIKFAISMPHQVIWGMEDTALLPVARQGLEEFAPNFKLTEIADAGHWINHTHSELVASEIQKFTNNL